MTTVNVKWLILAITAETATYYTILFPLQSVY